MFRWMMCLSIKRVMVLKFVIQGTAMGLFVNAEVDYVIQRGEQILPIEVKAGTKGQMQSMNLFLKERNLSTGIRISFENFASYKNIEVLPLYAINRLLGLNRVKLQ